MATQARHTDVVGAAGVEPATTGLENLRAYSLSPYPSVFAAPWIFLEVHSVTFGCDLLRGIGQSSGRISAPYAP